MSLSIRKGLGVLVALATVGACQENASTVASQEASSSASPVATTSASAVASADPMRKGVPNSDPSAARGGLWGDETREPSRGFGDGESTPRKRPPSVRMGATSVTGRLPPEVIQRIVRQSFGKFRLCYENALKTDPKLAGSLSTTFTIKTDGSTADIKTSGSLQDKGVQDCVSKTFTGISFPQPESGVVKVTYPISFAPGDPPSTLAGKAVADVSSGDVEKALRDAGYTDIASKPKEGAKGAVVFTAQSAGKIFNVTFVPASAGLEAIPRLEMERLGKLGLVFREGAFCLIVESDDEKASQALLDAIVKRPQ